MHFCIWNLQKPGYYHAISYNCLQMFSQTPAGFFLYTICMFSLCTCLFPGTPDLSNSLKTCFVGWLVTIQWVWVCRFQKPQQPCTWPTGDINWRFQLARLCPYTWPWTSPPDRLKPPAVPPVQFHLDESHLLQYSNM